MLFSETNLGVSILASKNATKSCFGEFGYDNGWRLEEMRLSRRTDDTTVTSVPIALAGILLMLSARPPKMRRHTFLYIVKVK